MNESVFGKYGVEIELISPENFLKIKESLTRIGIASKKENTLYQSCHILHKRGKYAIVHFKELFELDRKSSDISEDDIRRRNYIAKLLEEWGLVRVVNPDQLSEVSKADIRNIKILKFSEKEDWDLRSKYVVGRKK